MKRDDFLAGKPFKINGVAPFETYQFIGDGDPRDNPGRIDVSGTLGTDYYCNVKKVTRGHVHLYRSFFGKIHRVCIKLADLIPC